MTGMTGTNAGIYSISDVIDNSKITAFQWLVFLLCFFVTTCDGFDTQSIAFTGPAIIQAFGLPPASLAPMLTAGIVGMVLGSMILGLIGDRIGRRPALFLAVLLFGLASLAIAFAGNPNQIIVLRFVAGLGMGGATPLVLALTAEYCPVKSRGAIMAGVLLGSPVGAIVGGLLAARMLPTIGWRGIFAVGGLLPLGLLGILYFGLPESLQFLARINDASASAKINRAIEKISPISLQGKQFILPEMQVKASVTALFSGGLARNTAAIWAVYMFNWIAWFMFLSWFPTVLKATGFSAAQAPLGTVAVNAVLVVFVVPFCTILPFVNTKKLLLGMFASGITTSIALAYSDADWTMVLISAGFAAFFIGAEQLVLNYMVAQTYPSSLRATAAGWSIGIGRIGAIIGSASGGWVLLHGGPAGFYLALIGPLVLAAMCLTLVKTQASSTKSNLVAYH